MQTRDKIIFETKKLFLENGVKNVNISSILDNAGVSNGTLFYYFKSKEKLALEIYQEIKDESENYFIDDEMVNMDFRCFIIEYWNRNIEWIIQNKLEYKFIKTFNDSKIVKEKYKINKSTKRFKEKIDHAIENNEISLENNDIVFKSFIHIRDTLIEYLFENEINNISEYEKLSIEMYERFLRFLD
ncbi:MAG: TetR/AcrR family transcriptional regulator [Bacilli bacterium]